MQYIATLCPVVMVSVYFFIRTRTRHRHRHGVSFATLLLLVPRTFKSVVCEINSGKLNILVSPFSSQRHRSCRSMAACT